jgi:hypothetical protein
VAQDELARLRGAMLATALSPELAPVMGRLLLSGFSVPDPADYRPLATLAAGSAIPLEVI